MVHPLRSEPSIAFGNTARCYAATALLVLVAGCASTSSAVSTRDAEAAAADTGFYTALRLQRAAIRGDFDNEVEGAGSSIVFVPDVDPGRGFALAIGGRTPTSGFEAEYSRSKADGDFGADVTFQNLLFNYRYYFNTRSCFQPFLKAGLGFAAASVEDGSSDSGDVDDADMYGFAVDLGGGLAYYITSHFAATLDAAYRLNRYFWVDGANSWESLDSSVAGDGLILGLGLAYTF